MTVQICVKYREFNKWKGMAMQCHEVDYEILGDDMQIVEIELDPGETFVAEAGAMNYMHDGITFEAKMGDGSTPGEGIMGKPYACISY